MCVPRVEGICMNQFNLINSPQPPHSRNLFVKFILIYTDTQLSESRWLCGFALNAGRRLPFLSDCVESVTAAINSRLPYVEVLGSLDKCRMRPKTVVILIS